MLVEGKGKVPPAPERIRISHAEADFVREEARKRDEFRSYSSRADSWGRGMVPNSVLFGMLGEHALCSYLNRKTPCRVGIDRSLRRHGDGGTDLEIAGITIQVKTRVTSGLNLIRRVDDKKRLRGLSCDLFVFTSCRQETQVDLLGWIDADLIRDVGRLVKSRRGEHWNLEIEDKELEPMTRLVTRINLRRAA